MMNCPPLKQYPTRKQIIFIVSNNIFEHKTNRLNGLFGVSNQMKTQLQKLYEGLLNDADQFVQLFLLFIFIFQLSDKGTKIVLH